MMVASGLHVVAQEGQWYLLDVGHGLGRVLDLDGGRVFPPQSLDSLLAKGSWAPVAGCGCPSPRSHYPDHTHLSE